jgi:hypothetical protein
MDTTYNCGGDEVTLENYTPGEQALALDRLLHDLEAPAEEEEDCERWDFLS